MMPPFNQLTDLKAILYVVEYGAKYSSIATSLVHSCNVSFSKTIIAAYNIHISYS